MKIRIGTIHELQGEGYEILIDVPTRSKILAKFFDGKMITESPSPIGNDEPTLVP